MVPELDSQSPRQNEAPANPANTHPGTSPLAVRNLRGVTGPDPFTNGGHSLGKQVSTPPTPLPRYHKFHKLVKRTFTRLVQPAELGTAFAKPKLESEPLNALSATTSSDIFERSCTLLIVNSETPMHYLMENYTAPILDSTAELLTDPKVNYERIQLNCCGEDGEIINLGDDSGEDCDLFTPRSRLRLIISLSLMSCLDLSHCLTTKKKGMSRCLLRRDDPLSPSGTPGGAFFTHGSMSPTAAAGSYSLPTSPLAKPRHSPVLGPLDLESPVSDDALNATNTASNTTAAQNPNYLIDFYSFADICKTEDNCKGRKGSVFTILAQDRTLEFLRQALISQPSGAPAKVEE